jgi:membrane-bound lytic murein transglycosylase B
MKRSLIIGLLFFFLLAFSLPNFLVLAEVSPVQERQTLEEELKQLEEEISQYKKNVEETQKERKTLQNKIYILENQIKKLDLQIYQSNILIDDLGIQIEDTGDSIDKTALKIEGSKEKLANILRALYEEDQRPLVEILLAEGISDFFDNLVALETLNVKNQELLNHIKSLKITLEDQKQSLDEEKDDMENLVVVRILQRQENEKINEEQEELLVITKGQEATYQKILADTEKEAQEIRSRIFDLIGVPDAPTFGEAVDIAKIISAQTGIRPAFLLAVLKQESNIGQNVGQCYLKNTSTGSGVIISTGKSVSRVMKPSRDVQPFLQIIKDLGRDPLNTPVSCPMSYGYGGAMGPAQFIPSTWNIYSSRLSSILGKPADPWSIKDAFLASAIYLVDLGANRDVYGAEWCAAVSYFSGNCSRKNQIKYEFYGDNVRAIANGYEKDIQELEKLK